ncbi:MAG: hypothetical protein ACP5OA_03030 [Candidatus Woesearchaeota archaeon]
MFCRTRRALFNLSITKMPADLTASKTSKADNFNYWIRFAI